MNTNQRASVPAIAMFGVVVVAACAATVSALDDCDGSTPKSALCGTATPCQGPLQNPQTGTWYCPNQRIEQQFIQHQCNTGSGTGSTLCATTNVPLVCTKRYDCEYSELEDPDTGEVTRLCGSALNAVGVNNSTTQKTDYISCRDTSGG